MTHSITVLEIREGPRADAILGELAERLGLARVSVDKAGCAQIWLQLGPDEAEAAIGAALDSAGADWRQHVTIATSKW